MLNIYKENHPTYLVLGGITTDTELSDDNYAFWNNMQEKLKSVSIKKKIDILITLNLTEIESKPLVYNAKAYLGKNDKILEAFIFTEIPIQFKTNIHYKNVFNNVIDKIQKGKVEKNQIETNEKIQTYNDQINTLNFYLENLKTHLDSTTLTNEDFDLIEEAVNDIETYFANENVEFLKEEKRNESINTLSNILSAQIQITNTIHNKYI